MNYSIFTIINPVAQVILVICVLLSLINRASGQVIEKSDASALARMVGAEVLNQNSRAVVRNARSMGGDAERYEYLARWVMPLDGPFSFRVGGYFTVTNPNPKEEFSEPGGKIESPVIDLIRIAKRMNKLSELIRRISDIPNGDTLDQRQKLALLALAEIARGRMDSAVDHSEAFFEFASTSKAPLANRWPELLLLNNTTQIPAMYDISKDIFGALRPLVNQSREKPIAIHMQAVLARISFGESQPLKRWHPSMCATVMSRGAGLPNTRWHKSGGTLRCLSTHKTDYAHYQIPMTGDFDVEAETSLGAYQNGIVYVGGRWIQVPGSTGSYRGDYRSHDDGLKLFGQELTKPRDWLRYRTSIRKNQLTTMVNGRVIDQRKVVYAPWIAMRNNPGANGTIRNLRISGQPTIPDTVYPLREGIGAWSDYKMGVGHFWWVDNTDSNPTMIGNPEPNDTPVELLVHYHRPIVEDGVIEYDFFYKSGEYAAHPALERLAFLLRPEGIRLHWVNNGIYDKSLDFPFDKQKSKLASEPLSLKEDDWNHVRLEFNGDQMQIAVNGDPAYTHKIVQSQRRLGLFHIANESTLKVRNLAWSGEWPKELPAPMQQELAGDLPECLLGLESMQEFVRIKFNQPIDSRLFEELSNNSSRYPSSTGLRIEPRVDLGWRAYRLRGRNSIYGDFDATVRFSDFKAVNTDGQADFVLRFFDDHENGYGTSLAVSKMGHKLVGLKYVLQGTDEKKIYGAQQYGDDVVSGSLRFIRRGDMVYSLIAYGDSDRYHLNASRKLADPTSPLTLRLEASRSKTATLSVVLHELAIRVNPPGERKRDPRVDALAQVTNKFERRFLHNFTQPVDQDLISASQANATATGLELKASQTPAVVRCKNATGGNFDVAFSLRDLELNADSNLAMKLDIGDQPTRVELAVRRGADENSFEVVARSKPDDGQPLDLGTFSLESVETLRLTRLQRTVFFVCESETRSRVIGFLDVGTGPIRPGSIQLALTSESTPAVAHLTSLQIRSTQP